MPANIRNRRVSLTLSVPASVENEVAREAETRGLSRSALITELLIRALNARTKLLSTEQKKPE